MNFTVHSLKLHRNILFPQDTLSEDGTIAVFLYSSMVKPNELEPQDDQQLTGSPQKASISAGDYLFAQGLLKEPFEPHSLPTKQHEALFRLCAKELWLESLWREISLLNQDIFVRILSEDNKIVFQVFRPVHL